jgi:hypothetical protein
VICALAAVQLMAPAVVSAVGTVTGIVDNDSDTDLARVDSGKLRVGDGTGNLTVDGTVVPFHHSIANTFTAGLSPSTQTVVFPGGGVQGATNIFITSLILNNVGTTSVEVDMRSILVSSASTCDSPTGGNLLKVRLSAGESEEFTWPEVTPFRLTAPSGNRLCPHLTLPSAPANTSVNIVLTYYLSTT